jgi:hypothetical protein
MRANEDSNKANLRRYTQIKIHNPNTNNLPFGDNIQEPYDSETILFHNINGFKDKTNWFQILMTMYELKVEIFGFVETNQQLNKGKKYEWINPIRKLYFHSRTTHSESAIDSHSDYKPGSTILMITGKWQARVSDQGQDSRGLGRWSFFQISSKKKSLIIITAYRPCISHGPSTAWIQQWTLLREEGDPNPDPIRSFYQDLEKQLMTWTQEGKEIILMIDANESVGDKPGGITSIIGKAGLTDMIRFCQPHDEDINTHSRGTKQIDYIFGSAGVLWHCNRAGILPFGSGYQSDHRALFIRIRIEGILASTVQGN